MSAFFDYTASSVDLPEVLIGYMFDGDAADRGGEHPRGHRLPDERQCAGPAARGTRPGFGAAAARGAHQIAVKQGPAAARFGRRPSAYENGFRRPFAKGRGVRGKAPG